MSQSYSLRRLLLAAVALVFILSAGAAMAQWTPYPAMSTSSYYAHQAIVNGKLYDFGGFSPSAGYLSSAQALDISTTSGFWTGIAALPEPRYGGAAVALNGKIYIFGGVNGTSNTALNSVLEYNPATDTYNQMAPMPTNLLYMGATAIGNKIYVVGGYTGTAIVNTVSIFDPVANSWSAGTSYPIAVADLAVTSVGNDIYAVGGQNSGGSIYKSAYKGTVSGATITWTALAPYPIFIYRAAAGVISGKPIFAGGATSTGIIADAYYFDAGTSNWVKTYPLPAAAAMVYTLPSDGTGVYYVGGSTSSSALATVSRLTIGAPAAIVTVPNANVFVTVVKGNTKDASLAIKNGGALPVTGTLTIPGDASWVTAGSVNADPFSDSAVALTIDASALAAGTYKTTATLTTNDADHPTVPVTIVAYVLDAPLAVQNTRVLFEEASGAWCGPCGAYGVPGVKALIDQYGENITVVGNHDHGGSAQRIDPYATTITESLNQRLGLNAYPTAGVERWTFDGTQRVDLGNWPTAVQSVLDQQPLAPMALEVTSYNYDASKKQVNATIKLTASQAIVLPTGSTLQLTTVITEDSLRWQQYEATDNPFFHMHVARMYYPSINGQAITIPATSVDTYGATKVIKPGSVFTQNLTFTVTGDSAAKNSHIVYYAALNASPSKFGNVLQSHEDDLTAKISGGASVSLTLVGQTSKTIVKSDTAAYTATVKNVSDAPISVTVQRTANTVPSGWTSFLCADGQCQDATQDALVLNLAVGQSAEVTLNVVGGTAPAVGTVSLRFSGGTFTQDQDYVTTTTDLSGVNDAVAGVNQLSLESYPNPARTDVRFDYTMPKNGNAGFEFFNAAGAKVLTVPGVAAEAGKHSATVNVSALPAGTYTVVLTANGMKTTRTITVVR